MRNFKKYIEMATGEKDPEDYPFMVVRVVRTGYSDDPEYRYPVKGFDTEEEANAFVDNEDYHNQDYDTSFVVVEN